jgi:hypothetical protein
MTDLRTVQPPTTRHLIRKDSALGAINEGPQSVLHAWLPAVDVVGPADGRSLAYGGGQHLRVQHPGMWAGVVR